MSEFHPVGGQEQEAMSYKGGKVPARTGDALDDLCRVCKTVRGHTVIVADLQGIPLRVICDYCGSQHNYRGGEVRESNPNLKSETAPRPQIPLVTERERRSPVPDIGSQGDSPLDLELLLRWIICLT